MTFYTLDFSILCRLPKYCSILTAELAAIHLVLEHLASSPQLQPSLIFFDSFSAPITHLNPFPLNTLIQRILLLYSFSSFLMCVSFMWILSHRWTKLQNCFYTSSSLPVIPYSTRSTLIFRTTGPQEMATPLATYSNLPMFYQISSLPLAIQLRSFTKETILCRFLIVHSLLTAMQKESLFPQSSSTDRFLHPTFEDTIFLFPFVTFFVIFLPSSSLNNLFSFHSKTG